MCLYLKKNTMTGLIAGSVSGGSVDLISYPLDENHSTDDFHNVEEAIIYANEALDAAQRLEEGLSIKTTDPLAQKLLNVAVESHVERFKIPAVALEDSQELTTELNHRTSRLKKVINYLYAVVQRVFKVIFDFFGTQKVFTRKLMAQSKQYIGESDSLSVAVGNQLNIKDRSLMTSLQIDGIAPKKAPELFDALAVSFEKQHSFSAVPEVIRLVAATKAKNTGRVVQEATELRDILEEGLKHSLTKVDDISRTSVFYGKQSESSTYYTSEPMFGHNYIFGVIDKKVSSNGSFGYQCGIRRDAEVPLRVGSFPVLAPDEIRVVCRTSLRICENIIRFSRDEVVLQKAMREITFIATKEVDKSSVVALRNLVAVGQNSYVVYLRFVTRIMQAMMRWCAISIKRYKDVE